MVLITGVRGPILGGRGIQCNLKVHLGDIYHIIYIIKIYFARKFRGRELNEELLGVAVEVSLRTTGIQRLCRIVITPAQSMHYILIIYRLTIERIFGNPNIALIFNSLLQRTAKLRIEVTMKP